MALTGATLQPFDVIDATDLPPINLGSGGFGLGAPAPGYDPGTVAPSFFFNGVNNDGGVLTSAGRGALNPATTPGGSANPTAAAAGIAQGGSANPGQTDIQSGSTAGTLQNYFVRASVIVLGFIFVAAGLYLFGERK